MAAVTSELAGASVSAANVHALEAIKISPDTTVEILQVIIRFSFRMHARLNVQRTSGAAGKQRNTADK
jgi:hypothetical protein